MHEVTIDYCRQCQKSNPNEARCAGCPEPQLLPAAQPGVAAFLLVHTQWNVGGLGQRTGLRYESVIATLDRTLPRWQADDPETWGERSVADLLADIQVIETAMLGADAERYEIERAAKGE